MRSALALYALRFGGWLLSRGARVPVTLTVDLFDEHSTTLTRSYGFDA